MPLTRVMYKFTHKLMMSFPVCSGSDDSKDADSLLDETVANSNQNNSNCSSPSRMSDSVSLTTDSSQDNSLCTPERETKIPLIPKNRYTHTHTIISFLTCQEAHDT